MPDRMGPQIFSYDPDANLHGRVAHIIDRGVKGYQVPDIDGLPENHPVNREGQNIMAAVTRSAGICNPIQQFKDLAAMYFPGKIDLVRRHQQGHFQCRLFIRFFLHDLPFVAYAEK
jgi:hypothetical protein